MIIYIYGWSISLVDKTYNIPILDTDGIVWPAFKSINIWVLYSKYKGLNLDDVKTYSMQQLSDYENGLRNAIVKTKPKDVSKFSKSLDFSIRDDDSFFNLQFKEIC